MAYNPRASSCRSGRRGLLRRRSNAVGVSGAGGGAIPASGRYGARSGCEHSQREAGFASARDPHGLKWSELRAHGRRWEIRVYEGGVIRLPFCQEARASLRFEREPGKKCIQQIDILDPETRVTLELMPDAVIVGHIRSQRGVPIKQLGVTLMPIQDAQGAQLNAQGLSYVTTDEEGAFKFANLQPGSYLLRTSNAVDPDEAHPEPNTIDENVDHGYVATYYPDALDRANAKAIVVASGKSATVDLTLQNEKFQPVSVPYASDKVAATASIGWGLDCGGRGRSALSGVGQGAPSVPLLAPNGSCKFGDHRMAAKRRERREASALEGLGRVYGGGHAGHCPRGSTHAAGYHPSPCKDRIYRARTVEGGGGSARCVLPA